MCLLVSLRPAFVALKPHDRAVGMRVGNRSLSSVFFVTTALLCLMALTAPPRGRYFDEDSTAFDGTGGALEVPMLRHPLVSAVGSSNSRDVHSRVRRRMDG